MKGCTFIFALLIVVCQGCAKKQLSSASVDTGLSYYPAVTGKYVEYEIDSLVYIDLPLDTIVYKFMIREKLSDSYTDNLGQPAIRLERFIKRYDPKIPYDNMPWKIREVCMVSASTENVQILEGNIRYTKLAFPVVEKSTWNGNALNTLPAQEYSYEYAGRNESLNNNNLEVLKVSQKEFRTLISYESQSEKYAKGLGLIQKEIYSIFSNSIVPGKPVEQRIENGFIYKQKLVTYGYE